MTYSKIQILAISITLLLTLGKTVHSENQTTLSEYKKPKIINAIDFEARLETGNVLTSWKRYKRNDFAYYEVIKSRSNKELLSENIQPLYTTDDPNQTSYNHQGLDKGIWYYRVRVITKDNRKWISPIVQVLIQENDSDGTIVSSKDFE